ncbi:DUF4280 domain-containing protein [uncultured Clostridium sp.]|uniref:DUF4280 domain-containing protein n=1 Tax=uncultured Clostridium sp. TaxID=59620 RepID=UPI0028EC5CF6|nr:DUF4280 domain-containing protein [uncultured Clostridium sp.]
MGISYVVDKAKIKCSKAIGESVLNKSPDNENLELHGKVMLTIADNKPDINITPFPLCESKKNPEVIKNGMKPVPCKPSICNKWIKGEKDVYLNGELALNSGCELTCLYGGLIKISDDGQRK